MFSYVLASAPGYKEAFCGPVASELGPKTGGGSDFLFEA